MKTRILAVGMVAAVLTVAALATVSSCLKPELKELNPCLVSAVVDEVNVDKVDRVDMLFVIDKSLSMTQEQSKIRNQFKRLITVLTSGDKNPDDGVTERKDFMPAKDLHLGVVTSDMGLPKIEPQDSPDPDYCRDLGDDGIMVHVPHPTIEGVPEAALNCVGPFNNFFLTFQPGMNVAQTATDFACIAGVGPQGCGFEQQLEAGLKALWPTEPSKEQKEDFKNIAAGRADEISFLAGTGHGDQQHASFLRGTTYNPDPVERQKLSLLAIVVVSDEEDCSVGAHGNQDILRRPESSQLPGWMDAIMAQNLNLRCYYDDIRQGDHDKYPVERYIAGFKALRPGSEYLVVFAAIVGVPVDAIKKDDQVDTDKDNVVSDAERSAYLQGILNHQFMQEQEDPNHPGYLLKACVLNNPAYISKQQTPDIDEFLTAAEPGRRYVQVASAFGANGVVHSICEDSFTPAMDAIIDAISKQLGGVCLPRTLIRRSDNKVGCDIVWLMGPGETCSSKKEYLSYLKTPDPKEAPLTDPKTGRYYCIVNQIPVINRSAGTGVGTNAAFDALDPNQLGWYYDDFSASIKKDCKKDTQRIAFRLEGNQQDPPPLTTVKLECLNEAHTLMENESGGKSVGDECDPGTDQCGNPKKYMCHISNRMCVQLCSTTANCPPAWVCDTRASTKKAAGAAICVNPTCGD